MQISKISEVNFTSRNRTLSKKQLNNVREIAAKINRPPNTVYHDDTFTSVRIGYIESKLDDTYFYNNNTENTSEIIMKNGSIMVDRKSGRITKVDKPFFMPLKDLLKIAGEYFDFFNKNFDNTLAVKKNCLLERGYIDECDGKTYITDKKRIR